MALAPVVLLDVSRLRLALEQPLLIDLLRVRLPVIRAKQLDIPFLKAAQQLAQGYFVPAPAFPVNKLSSFSAIRFPNPELVFFKFR